MKIYLAGPIRGQTLDEAQAWRRQVISMLANEPSTVIKFLNPLRHKPWLEQHHGAIMDAYPEQVLGSGAAITERDLWDVRSCDVVLANLSHCDVVSVGTCLELGYAKAHNKIIVIVLDANTENPHRHAMLINLTPFVVANLEAAITTIKGLL